MSEQLYMDADYEVISMVNKKRGCGGQLPSKTIRFIPEDRADSVLKLDERIQRVRELMPVIVTGAIIVSFILGLSL